MPKTAKNPTLFPYTTLFRSCGETSGERNSYEVQAAGKANALAQPGRRRTANRATKTAAAKISPITASSATSNGTGAIFAKNANRFRLPRKYAAKAASAAVRQEERKATSRTGI